MIYRNKRHKIRQVSATLELPADQCGSVHVPVDYMIVRWEPDFMETCQDISTPEHQ